MHDEFRGSLARQGITEEAYLKAVEKTSDDLHADFRPNAEKRAKTLLVLSKVADEEGVEVADADVDAEVARGRERYAGDARLIAYFESDRGRVVHPQHAPPQPRRRADHRRAGWPSIPSTRRCRTSKRSPASASTSDQAQANAAIGATDPEAVLDDPIRPIRRRTAPAG